MEKTIKALILVLLFGSSSYAKIAPQDTFIVSDSLTRVLHLLVDSNAVVEDTLFIGEGFRGENKLLDEGDIAAIKDPFWLGEDLFPVMSLVYKDSTWNNIDSSNYITISSISGTGDTRDVTFNWLPYRKTLFSPTAGENWAVVITNSWQSTATEPNISGDATEILTVNSGTYATKTLNLTDRTTWSISEGDTCVIYNPFGGSWEWCSEPILEPGGVGWRATYIQSGPLFMHSDGYIRMLVNGTNKNGTTVQTVGMFKCHPDSLFTASAWSVCNSDAAVIDTLVSSNRGVSVLAISVLPLYDVDGYIVYTMTKNDGECWYIRYVVIDEDGTILEDPGTDIMGTKPTTYDNSASMGLSAPSVVRYGGKYIMLFCNRDNVNADDPADLDHWNIFEAYSYGPRGPFTTVDDSIFARHADNKISYRSAYPDVASTFVYKGRIYALVAGTSMWHQSGSKANRQWGLAYRNERDGTTAWIEDVRNPIWINVMQKYTGWDSYDPIWGTGQGSNNTYYYASDHSGGYTTFYSNSRDGYLYVFFSSNSAADDYRVWGMRLDASLW